MNTVPDTQDCREGLRKFEIDNARLQFNNLICLPKSVSILILDYLESDSLRSLRGVCKETKSWIDSPRYLKKIRIWIRDLARMKEIIKSEIPWSNAALPCKRTNRNEFNPFLQKFNSSLLLVKVCYHVNDECRPNLDISDLINMLFYVSPFLESLNISCNLDSSKHHKDPDRSDYNSLIVDRDLAVRKLLEESSPVLKKNLLGLKVFKLLSSCYGSDGKESALLAELILDICPNLESIKFSSNVWSSGVYKKLVTYKEQIWLRTKPVLTISFDPVLVQHKNEISTFENHCKLSTSTLLDLAKPCEKGHTFVKLFNVPIKALPNLTDVTEYEKLCLNQCVGSVRWTHQDFDEITKTPRYLPPGSELEFSTRLTLYGPILGQFVIPNFRNINILSISINSYYYPTDFNLVYEEQNKLSDLFIMPLPSVTKLILSGAGILKHKCSKLSAFFPNLKKLVVSYIYDLDCFSDDGLLNGLHHLENLTFYFCSFRTNCFIGDERDINHPLFKKFKKLKRLRMSHCISTFVRSTFRY